MKAIFILFVLFLFSVHAVPEKIATFPDLEKPSFLEMDDKHFYIVDGASICIYSITDFKLNKKFGKAGVGPKEFKVSGNLGVMVFPQKDFLVINSIGKVSIFTKDGNFIKELKSRSKRRIFGFFQPIDDFFAGLELHSGENQSMLLSVFLFDSELKKVKEIYRQKLVNRGKFNFPVVLPVFMVRKNKIIIGGEEDFIINILDSNGKKVTSIFREYQKLRVDEKYKEKVFNYFKTNPRTKSSFLFLKVMAKFSEYFPAIRFFYADQKKIYIMTYKIIDDKHQFFIYDMNGKFLKEVFLPVKQINPFTFSPWIIKNDKLYQLIENEENKKWELHLVQVK